jgi:hypothetical protein
MLRLSIATDARQCLIRPRRQYLCNRKPHNLKSHREESLIQGTHFLASAFHDNERDSRWDVDRDEKLAKRLRVVALIRMKEDRHR